jgi:hypothetical protein
MKSKVTEIRQSLRARAALIAAVVGGSLAAAIAGTGVVVQ